MLRKIAEETGLSAIGKMTISTKEWILLIHYCHDAVVATDLRYRDEVTDPSRFAELKDLPEAGKGNRPCSRRLWIN
jgi:non-homologous end joining protein Ku